MKKYISTNLSYIFLVLTILCTICMLFIIYKDIDTPLSTAFIIGYTILLLGYFLYFIFTITKYMWKSDQSKVQKRLLKFVIIFLGFSITKYLFNYFFQSSNLQLSDFATTLGVSFSLAFWDVLFTKKQ
ncbi:hypothetical protein COK19_16445 [Bacillus cereus]|uniref:hypothetical protein n=1 Tax=Bacillus cereus TaxID=1396 RepID=UPI000BF744CC|nr:hypothetical protein [Bacillus cereus]PFR24937.1 hypothetical protein COK19_16445 [Bacillus cereus]